MLISPSKKVYVGQTDNLKRRFKQHERARGDKILYNAINLYGWDNFLKVIIEVFEDDVSDSVLNEREIYWIKEHEAYGKNGYNGTKGGGGVRGHKHSAETRAKIAESSRGRRHTQETKARLREINLGKKMSQDSRAKLSEAMKGRFVSAKARLKISEATKRAWRSEEFRRKHSKAVSKANKGRKVSAETRAKLSAAQMGHKGYHVKEVAATCIESGTKRKFDTIKSAVDTLSQETGLNFDDSCISKCCKKKQKKHHGYAFNYVTQALISAYCNQ